eukprot:316591-Rhodomonas_salina.1
MPKIEGKNTRSYYQLYQLVTHYQTLSCRWKQMNEATKKANVEPLRWYCDDGQVAVGRHDESYGPS